MDRTATGLDFAVIGHQDSWERITALFNQMRGPALATVSSGGIRDIFGYIPPTDLFSVQVNSTNGSAINGVYIDTFIDPCKLDAGFGKANLSKVMRAVAHAQKLGAKIVALGGFTSIVLEGQSCILSNGSTMFTTGNTLTAAYIVKAIERAALIKGKDLRAAAVLIIGATGDIGMACTAYFKNSVSRLLLCARNPVRLRHHAESLRSEGVAVKYDVDLQALVPDADIIISVASSAGIRICNARADVLICDAGYPKNLDQAITGLSTQQLFQGGMGQVSAGFNFSPDYSEAIYAYPAPGIIHGCILEAMVLAFEHRFEAFSTGRGNITAAKMNTMYEMGQMHGIDLAPFFNNDGLWNSKKNQL